MTKKIRNLLIVLAIPVVIFLIFAAITPYMGLQSIKAIVSQAMIPSTMGFGIAFCMEAGLFDLSAGVRVILSSSIGVWMAVTLNWGIAGLIIGCIIGSILIGGIMGAAFNFFRIPSLVLSLCAVMLFEVLAYVFLGFKSMQSITPAQAGFGKFPYNIIICVVCAVAFYFVYYRTKFAYNVRMIGEDEQLAKNMGINAKKINLFSFIIGGVFLGIVSILYVCSTNSIIAVSNMASLSMVFKPMMGVMIGVELLGLVNNLALNILIGELCISLIFNGLLAIGLPSTTQDVALGIFMIVVMAFSANRAVLKKIFQKTKTL